MNYMIRKISLSQLMQGAYRRVSLENREAKKKYKWKCLKISTFIPPPLT